MHTIAPLHVFCDNILDCLIIDEVGFPHVGLCSLSGELQRQRIVHKDTILHCNSTRKLSCQVYETVIVTLSSLTGIADPGLPLSTQQRQTL